jgi:hypothetical protein
MGKGLKFKEMLKKVERGLADIPEHRKGENTKYEIKDAGLGAFSVFYLQAPSFLSWQQDMERKRGKNNARNLFGIKQIPSDEQIKNLLDPVEEQDIGKVIWQIYHALDVRGQLQKYEGVNGTRTVSLDGTQHHSSQKVHCEQCRVTIRGEKAYYEHQVLMAVLSAPGQKHVVCLEPEFITPQDGHAKQDCEQAAIKRWVQAHAEEFAPRSVTILTDDLHCHQPTCELFRKHQMYFILTCKEDSHTTLYEELALLARVEGAIGTKTVSKWNGRHREQWIYRWAESLPLRRGKDALLVNWCELTVINESTGERMYYNAWATNHKVNGHTVVAIAAAGRSRWKVENEGINILKNHGYNFKHNYGHGKQNLANVLLNLLLLAFLFHTVLHLGCEMYQAVRRELGARRNFFYDLRALTRYILFDSWLQLLTYMYQGLDLSPG